jgi:hypothetical protein
MTLFGATMSSRQAGIDGPARHLRQHALDVGTKSVASHQALEAVEPIGLFCSSRLTVSWEAPHAVLESARARNPT